MTCETRDPCPPITWWHYQEGRCAVQIYGIA